MMKIYGGGRCLGCGILVPNYGGGVKNQVCLRLSVILR